MCARAAISFQVLEGALSCFFVPQKQRALPGAEAKANFRGRENQSEKQRRIIADAKIQRG